MEIRKCTCGEELELPSNLKLVTCKGCGKTYKNPFYVNQGKPSVGNELRPVRSSKEIIKLVLTVVFILVIVSTFIMSAIGISYVSTDIKIDSLVKKLLKHGYEEVYAYTGVEYQYDTGAKIVARIDATKGESQKSNITYEWYYDKDITIIIFDSVKSAKSAYDRYYQSEYKRSIFSCERKGKIIYIGNSLSDIL